jgi:hypothetical protein
MTIARVVKENGASGLRAKTGRLLLAMKQAGEPIWYLKTSGSAYQRAGVPDFVVSYNGSFGTLELKSPGERPTPPQEHELRWVSRSHGLAGWTDSMKGVQAFLETLKTPVRLYGAVLRSLDGELIKFE